MPETIDMEEAVRRGFTHVRIGWNHAGNHGLYASIEFGKKFSVAGHLIPISDFVKDDEHQPRFSIPCSICGEWPNPPHIVGMTAFCAEHCHHCRPIPSLPLKEWGELQPVAGQQADLFAET